MKEKILLIDDGADILALLASVLKNEGYAVLTAADGDEGIERFQEKHPDLVISDIRMPGKDGIAVLRTIKEAEADVDVIMLTGYSDETTAIDCLRLGACDYLLKPMQNLNVLLLLVRRALHRRELEQEVRSYRKQLEELTIERTLELTRANTEAKRLTEELQQEITERKKMEEQITIAIQEKTVLLQEIHHRVKNNLQIVASLLNLQADLCTDDRTPAILRESWYRVHAMALVHEQLYGSKDLTQVDVAAYIKDLTADLFYTYGNSARPISLAVEAAGAGLDIDKAIPCGLIVNELVSNALKYAFPAEHDRSDDRQVTIRVDD
ncbi:MAG: response regulator [bacterium]|nr:response regulator [bacterium]